MQVIIAAAGQGKRLYTESLEIQKPLFYYQCKPIIAHLIDLYLNYSKDISIILSENDLGKFTEAWLIDYYKNPKWLNIIWQPKPAGTADALSRVTFSGEPVLISWADFIIEKSDFDSLDLKEDTFIVSDVDCRFGVVDNKITQKQSNPGFIGLYYFNKPPELNLQNEDFIENFIGEEKSTKYLPIKNLGTIKELVEYNAFEKKSNRYFNSIEFKDDIVIKTALTEGAIKLQEKEINWYRNTPKELFEHLPEYKVENNNLILQKLNAVPISNKKLESSFWRKDLIDLLNKLHAGNYKVDIKSCEDVYLNKPKQRLDEVKNITNAWFSKNKIINNELFDENYFNKFDIDSFLPKEFTFIHGDLQFSNSMIDENNKIYLIDPRGYFGNSELIGDPAYDIAKILYALDAYHKINENMFSVHKLSDFSTQLIHFNEKLSKDQLYFFDWAMEKYGISRDKLNFLVCGIWFSLTGYIIDNPLAVIASYCKGMIRTKYGLL